MGLNESLVGKSYDTAVYEVTAEAIERYARATNDLNDRYLQGDVVGSPVFPVVASFPAFMAAATDPELGADLGRLVHSAEDHTLFEPLRPGDRLRIAAALESVVREDAGEAFTVATEQINQRGELVAGVRGTMFIRGAGSARRHRRPLVDRSDRAIVYEEATKIDEDQTARYAEASGDHNPIHLDESAAKGAGLPGIIVHGMCTMAVAAKAAVDGLAGGDPTRVRRVRVSFAKPVYPGQELTTKVWETSSEPATTTYGFETLQSAGVAVVKQGEVEISTR